MVSWANQTKTIQSAKILKRLGKMTKRTNIHKRRMADNNQMKDLKMATSRKKKSRMKRRTAATKLMMADKRMMKATKIQKIKTNKEWKNRVNQSRRRGKGRERLRWRR